MAQPLFQNSKPPKPPYPDAGEAHHRPAADHNCRGGRLRVARLPGGEVNPSAGWREPDELMRGRSLPHQTFRHSCEGNARLSSPSLNTDLEQGETRGRNRYRTLTLAYAPRPRGIGVPRKRPCPPTTPSHGISDPVTEKNAPPESCPPSRLSSPGCAWASSRAFWRLWR